MSLVTPSEGRLWVGACPMEPPCIRLQTAKREHSQNCKAVALIPIESEKVQNNFVLLEPMDRLM